MILAVSPICTVNGQSTANGVDVAPGEVALIELASTAGVDVWTVECIGTDETSDKDTINSGLLINVARKSAALTAPGAGKALIFRSKVNGTIATTFGVYTLGSGNRVGAINETTEGSALFGWLPIINRLLRSTSGLGGRTVKVITGGTITLTSAESASLTLHFTGALTAPAIAILPAIDGYAKCVRNDTTGNFPLTVKTPTGAGVIIPPKQNQWVICDGSNLL